MDAKTFSLVSDFVALISMAMTGVYDDWRVLEIRERFEAREAQRREP